ncbi:MAG: hypothetical protein FWE24_04010 [Defluviitaleaceae bacterium]|nr:hypothetical protein [Defluviitaleaceae bacterium]
MPKEIITFEQFLSTVNLKYQGFIQELHNYLLDNNCKPTFEQKSNGYFVSYKEGKPQKSIANFLFRKKGLIVRVYGENICEYLGLLETLPDEMAKAIEKAPICKRFTDPTVCNQKCIGYDFTMNGKHFQKCKIGCFMFFVNDENNPYIKKFTQNEIERRKNQCIT